MNKTHARRGQSLVEFALVLPVLLAIVGATTDFARLYSGWIGIQSAVRNASEYLATDPNGDVTSANASTIATDNINAELTALGTFTTVSTLTCAGPEVQAAYSSNEFATGASESNPLGRATVTACLPFRPLFSYPFITQNGAWPVRVSATYEVLQNR
jgi:Flp pilus assembly protein TadG